MHPGHDFVFLNSETSTPELIKAKESIIFIFNASACVLRSLTGGAVSFSLFLSGTLLEFQLAEMHDGACALVHT